MFSTRQFLDPMVDRRQLDGVNFSSLSSMDNLVHSSHFLYIEIYLMVSDCDVNKSLDRMV